MSKKWVEVSKLGRAALASKKYTDGKIAELTATTNTSILRLKSKLQPPNMLFNPWFMGSATTGKLPINQRNNTVYNGPNYTIDRWYASANGRVTTGSLFPWPTKPPVYGALFTNVSESGNVTLSQSLPVWMLEDNATYTFSFVWVETTDNPPRTNSTKLFKGLNKGSDNTLRTTEIQGVKLYSCDAHFLYSTFTIPSGFTDSHTNDVFTLGILVPGTNGTGNANIGMVCAKLEKGSESTLAHVENNNLIINEQPPNYVTELIKCQTYYERFKNPITLGIRYSVYQDKPCLWTTPSSLGVDHNDLSPVRWASTLHGWYLTLENGASRTFLINSTGGELQEITSIQYGRSLYIVLPIFPDNIVDGCFGFICFYDDIFRDSEI